jgi:hypothetical protein
MQTFWDYQEEQKATANGAGKSSVADEMRLDAERQELLNNISSSSVNTLRDKVAWILNHYPETRDSDISLQLRFWETFESDIYNGHSVTPDDYRKLTRLTSVVRERAKIQNQYRLFVASPEVRKVRGTLSDDEKEKAIEDKPGYPVFIVYLDDSGKTGSHLLVGSVWFLAGGYQSKLLSDEIHEFRETKKFHSEFHFKEMKKDELPIYKELVQLFLKQANAISFKFISLPRSGVGKVDDAFEDLYYHLLIQGIEHEDQTGRAPLPRGLQVWKDAEEIGSDKLLLANLEDRLKKAANSIYKDKLSINRLFAVDSKHNSFLQIADLLASSVNRIFNRSGESYNHKDGIAEYFLGALGIDLSLKPNAQMSDKTIHISL